ncbi:MAG: hypothetical protein IPG10_10150 [Flavobacteriales bacterium]|nr:hypothetical protein [Flavobacteriales bacterium]
MRRSTVLLVCVPVMPVVATTYPIAAQAAIRNNMGSAPLISCNEMDQTANGILFNGVAYNTDVRGNKMRHHKWALHLDGTAVIGTQTLKGNLWYNAAGGGGVCALYVRTRPTPRTSLSTTIRPRLMVVAPRRRRCWPMPGGSSITVARTMTAPTTMASPTAASSTPGTRRTS